MRSAWRAGENQEAPRMRGPTLVGPYKNKGSCDLRLPAKKSKLVRWLLEGAARLCTNRTRTHENTILLATRAT